MAVSDAAVVEETGDVVMPNVVLDAPAAIVTDAGTDTALLVLDSATNTGEAAAALSVIDPVAELPPTTEPGFAPIDASAGAGGGPEGFQPS